MHSSTFFRQVPAGVRALALVEVDTLAAWATVHARLRSPLTVTVGAQVTLGARVPVCEVKHLDRVRLLARTTVPARFGQAFVHVDLAIVAFVARHAHTRVKR